MSSIGKQIANILAEEIRQAIDDEIIAALSMNPKLIFIKTDNPLVLRYGMEHAPGTFTPTGLRDHHIEPIIQWCDDNSCGAIDKGWYQITFKSEAEVAWFLLRWS